MISISAFDAHGNTYNRYAYTRATHTIQTIYMYIWYIRKDALILFEIACIVVNMWGNKENV